MSNFPVTESTVDLGLYTQYGINFSMPAIYCLVSVCVSFQSLNSVRFLGSVTTVLFCIVRNSAVIIFINTAITGCYRQSHVALTCTKQRHDWYHEYSLLGI